MRVRRSAGTDPSGGIETGDIVTVPDRVARICDALADRKGSRIAVLEVSKLSAVADHFIIASAASRIAVQTLADAVRETVAADGGRAPRVEGYAEGRWICLDCADVVIHVFQHEVREYFDLERLWGDAPRAEWTVEPMAIRA